MPRQTSKETTNSNSRSELLKVIQDSTNRKEKMHKKVINDLATLEKTQKEFGESVNKKLSELASKDDLDARTVSLFDRLTKIEELFDKKFTVFSDKLYTRIDSLLAELENIRLDREFSTQKLTELENRVKTLEKAVN